MARKTNDDSSLSHTRWNCKYHIVFIPKYRRKEIYGKLRSDIGKIIRQLCEYKGVEIVEAHACSDHIHMLVKIPHLYIHITVLLFSLYHFSTYHISLFFDILV